MDLFLRAGQLLLGAAWVGASIPSCYSAGTGTAPPPNTFYFPVGLAVSPDGRVLYAVNSDFDLQYNGGTLQSYDLDTLRGDAQKLIVANLSGATMPPAVPFLNPSQWTPNCVGQPPPGGMPLGQGCSPPVDSKQYVRSTAVIGAFATELQVSIATAADGRSRLFMPVRGDATLTWADVGGATDRFRIDCGQGPDNRCDAIHHTGSDPNQDSQNTRHTTMPGEPFGMAQTEDGTAIAVTHQTDTKTSLLTTGLPSSDPKAPAPHPTMQFVLDGLPTGGVGIAAVPHDSDGPVKGCETVNDGPHCVRPAFLETSRNVAEIDLLRYYDDDLSGPPGEAGVGPSQHRPFLQREAAYAINSNAVGTDSRGIVIDPTPRIACKALPGADVAACAQLPARVFFASRTPPALGIGEIGGQPQGAGGTYDPDRLVLTGNVPLPVGPSKVYLAPVVDTNGNFAPRIFVVCFDSSKIIVYDPDAGAVENVISVGPGPFAMAFDHFDINEVGAHRAPSGTYRFAYVASFTESFVQMIDLDMTNPDPSLPTAETFERVVFTLGQPTVPKGR